MTNFISICFFIFFLISFSKKSSGELILLDDNLTCSDAQNACTNLDGNFDLISLTSSTFSQIVFSFFNSKSTNCDFFWLKIKRQNSSTSQWIWIDGTTVDFLNWQKPMADVTDICGLANSTWVDFSNIQSSSMKACAICDNSSTNINETNIETVDVVERFPTDHPCLSHNNGSIFDTFFSTTMFGVCDILESEEGSAFLTLLPNGILQLFNDEVCFHIHVLL